MSHDGVSLDSPVSALPGVGPARARAYAAISVETVRDLLLHLPRRQRALPPLRRVAEVAAGELVRVKGRVRGARASRRGRGYARVVLDDGSGSLEVFFFRRPYLAAALRRAGEVVVVGRVVERTGRLLVAAEDHFQSDEAEAFGEGEAFLPVYVLPPEIPPRLHRRLVSLALPLADRLEEDRVPEAPPEAGVASLRRALLAAHAPKGPDDAELVRRRLAFFEFLDLLSRLRRGRASRSRASLRVRVAPDEAEAGLAAWPFRPTSAQRRAVRAIAADLAGPHAMHRLLQGDVGSGKTAVVLAALELVARAGGQGALLVPTDLLAHQHFETARGWLEPRGVTVRRLTAGMRAAERRALLEELGSGVPLVVVGTHALLTDAAFLPRLALAVVDEQHRFGVAQRARLRRKNRGVHFLVVTATPIPRTLSLTIYGDLDVTRLDEVPAGRGAVATRLAFGREGFERAVEHLARDVDAGGRAFVVCPFVSDEGADPPRGAVQAARCLEAALPGRGVRLAHGRLDVLENRRAVDALRSGRAQVLVATVVVEVGVDVPEATTMLVLGAERFGLATLHQLRGRIGRGARPGECWLVAGSREGRAGQRLAVLERETDGFRIAEEDLRLRGAGRVFGREQHGSLELHHADPVADLDLLLAARRRVEASVSGSATAAVGRPEEPGPG